MTSELSTSSALAAQLQEADTHHQNGRLDEAEQGYRAILQTQPQHTQANYNLGVLYLQQAQPLLASPCFARALESAPELEQCWLANIELLIQTGQPAVAGELLEEARRRFGQNKALQEMAGRLAALSPAPAEPDAQATEEELLRLCAAQRYEEAEPLARRLTERLPEHPFGWKALGVLLEKQGRLEEALPAMSRAVQLQPEDAACHFNLGNLYKGLKQLEESQAWYRQAIALCPDAPPVHANLAATLMGLGQAEEAEASYRQALALDPRSAECWEGLGAILQVSKRHAEAESCFLQALAINPDYAKAHHGLGMVQEALDRPEEAENSCRKALELDPQLTGCHRNLGRLLRKKDALDEALSCYSQALKLDFDQPEVLAAMGEILFEKQIFGEAEWSFRTALRLNPAHPAMLHTGLGGVLGMQGRLPESSECLIKALELDPGYLKARQNLLFNMTHDPSISKEELFRAHREFGERAEKGLPAERPEHANSRNPERKLRVGFVSADLRKHPVAFFIEPILQNLDPDAFELYAYHSFHRPEDEVSDKLKRHFHDWHRVYDLSDEKLAALIRQDAIDILVDLSGHTGGNRLPMFALKPAPIQLTWIGYPGTTGLKAMDYCLVNKYCAPAGLLDSQFSEKLVRLPVSSVFQPYEDSPDVNELPALSSGTFVFGSFNRLSKLNDVTLALWGKVLQSVPHSRLLLGGIDNEETKGKVVKMLEAVGVAEERLILTPRASMRDYLKLHHRVDLLLDSTPYSGGTTTNHALWMGVPTLTLAGQTLPARQGVTALSYVGLFDFIAKSEEDYVAKAVAWSKRLDELAAIRAGLRERIANMDSRSPARVAELVGTAFREMWRRWCRGEAPSSFDVL